MPPSGWERNSSPEPLKGLADWVAGQGGLRAPAAVAREAVESFESRYAIRIPEDFRLYLLEVAPAEDLWDDAHTIWWPPSRVRNIPDEYEHPIENAAIAAEADAYLFFADYMIWCWAWAVCCSDGPNRGKVACIADPEGFVADSFTQFVERYLRDPEAMAKTLPSGGTAD